MPKNLKFPKFAHFGQGRKKTQTENQNTAGNSPRFDVFGNDFGWGRPVAVRSGGGNKVDGRATVYELGRGGGIGMELCLAPEALARLIADDEFMAVVNQGQ